MPAWVVRRRQAWKQADRLDGRLTPPPCVLTQWTWPPVTDRQRFFEWIFASYIPSHHWYGTCRMGTDPAKGAVTDSGGRVFGTRKLRVADASIYPIKVRAAGWRGPMGWRRHRNPASEPCMQTPVDRSQPCTHSSTHTIHPRHGSWTATRKSPPTSRAPSSPRRFCGACASAVQCAICGH